MSHTYIFHHKPNIRVHQIKYVLVHMSIIKIFFCKHKNFQDKTICPVLTIDLYRQHIFRTEQLATSKSCFTKKSDLELVCPSLLYLCRSFRWTWWCRLLDPYFKQVAADCYILSFNMMLQPVRSFCWTCCCRLLNPVVEHVAADC